MSGFFTPPKFEYRELLDKRLDTFGWLGHTYFAYDLVSHLKPNTIVELGTHWGISFFSFCQAAKDHSPSTHLYAIDTWQGEEHAGFYGEVVVSTVKEIKEKYFKTLHCKLLRKTFDQALADFDNNSIDLLHIDGLHTYEAVKHDFESWLPKLKKNGLVLFHDTSEEGLDFGVYKFWQELTRKYSQTIQLPHSHGLGVLCFDEKLWSLIQPLQTTWEAYYSLSHQKEILIKDLYQANKELKNTYEELAKANDRTNEQLQESKRLTKLLKDTARHADNLQAVIDDIRASKAYKLVHGLGRLRRIIKRKS